MWRITGVAVERTQARYRSFEAEVLFTGQDESPQCSTRVDGVWSESGLVHINRERDLRSLVESFEGNHTWLIDSLCSRVNDAATEGVEEAVCQPA